MERIILHSDLNNFFASVEAVLNPEYRGADKYIAVCGSESDRHGIVLAKNENAKRMGVKTGETIWQARQKCPGLTVVPPHFDKYAYYSDVVRDIYKEYTDEIEPFGMDECWLDVTRSTSLFGDGETIANTIRRRVKSETGLTVSVGVSFNKVFAKLCSDLKKPDAVTVAKRSDFKEKLWNLPADSMIGIGRQTNKVLNRHGVFTIGDIARLPEKYLEKWLGKCGADLHSWAMGNDFSPVAPCDYTPIPKSVSHDVTCRENLENSDEVSKIILYLSQDVSAKLRGLNMSASVVTLSVRDTSLNSYDFSERLTVPTRSHRTIHERAFNIFKKHSGSFEKVRAVTVRVSDLQLDEAPFQVDFFTDVTKNEKNEKKEATADALRIRYGKSAIIPASLLGDIKLPKILNESKMPHRYV
jgi:DNA polymerase-4